jgi:5-deoxy-glucuronate isomerase
VIIRHAPIPAGVYAPIVDEKDFGLGFGLIKLDPNTELVDRREEERCLMLLRGSVRFEWEGGFLEARRASMEEELPSSVSAGASVRILVKALSEGAELAVFSASSARGAAVLEIPSDEVSVAAVAPAHLKGTADRFIRTVLGDANAPDSGLTMGEVVTLPGRWSSFPPHHHTQVEIYHYRFFPSGGFGYSGLGDEVFAVRDGDTLVIPPGLVHPQVAAPGCTMIYAWGIRHLEGDRFRPESRIYPAEFDWSSR